MLSMSEYKDMVKEIVAEVSRSNVEAVFGEPRGVGDQTIIPVGKISYGWGGGGGKGKAGEPEQEGEGSGLGMGMRVKPLGFINISAHQATYSPIIDYGPILAVGTALIGLATLRLVRKIRTKRPLVS